MAKSAKPGVETPKLKKNKKKGEKKIKKQLIEENSEHEEEEVINRNDSPKTTGIADESGRSDEEEVTEEEQKMGAEYESRMLNNELIDKPKKKKKDQILKEATNADRRGICYLSRIPPHMDHVKLRHKLSQYGQILRIYLAPEDKKHQEKSKKRKDQGFSEGWVEFANKSNAKRVANMLNGEQIGGRKRSVFYYDLWNIKYLSKFKWDDLTEEIACKSAIREQKLALELSAAKRERDFYLSKVEKSHALSSIEERLRKKQKVRQDTGDPLSVTIPKVIRHFPQTKPVEDKAAGGKSNLSKDVLAGVFGAS